MAVNFKLLRRGAIYRINYGNWHTTPKPIDFVLFSGNLKVHALALNAIGMSSAEQLMFVRFINKMKNIPNIQNYSGRMLYRIIRMYYPSIVKKAYRTYFTSLITQHSLVSYGIIPPALFTDFEKQVSNKALFADANRQNLIKVIATFTGTVPKSADIGGMRTNYAKPAPVTPAKPVVQPAAPQPTTGKPINEPTTPTPPVPPVVPSTPPVDTSGLEGYE